MGFVVLGINKNNITPHTCTFTVPSVRPAGDLCCMPLFLPPVSCRISNKGKNTWKMIIRLEKLNCNELETLYYYIIFRFFMDTSKLDNLKTSQSVLFSTISIVPVKTLESEVHFLWSGWTDPLQINKNINSSRNINCATDQQHVQCHNLHFYVFDILY